MDPDEALRRRCLELEWPMFVLLGNGDVFLVHSTFHGSQRPRVEGPLPITPPSHANYGCEVGLQGNPEPRENKRVHIVTIVGYDI